MALSLPHRLLRFNFDPLWFVHSARLTEMGYARVADSNEAPDIEAANSALQATGLSGRWCFDFNWAPSRLALLSASELDWSLSQLALLALPEFRTLAVRREERDWIRSLVGAMHEGAASVGDVFRENGEFKPAPGLAQDLRMGLKRYGAAIWLAVGRPLGDAGTARMRLMLHPALDVPAAILSESQARLLYQTFIDCVDSQPGGGWSWLRS